MVFSAPNTFTRMAWSTWSSTAATCATTLAALLDYLRPAVKGGLGSAAGQGPDD